jgi:hypothetical protein
MNAAITLVNINKIIFSNQEPIECIASPILALGVHVIWWVPVSLWPYIPLQSCRIAPILNNFQHGVHKRLSVVDIEGCNDIHSTFDL